MLALLAAPVGAAYHIVFALAVSLSPVAGGLATAAAIIAFTVAVRLLLLPLSYYSLRGQVRMSALLPQAQQLQRRYAAQPDRLQRELSAFYRENGAGLLGGCLPMLLQLPFFSVMYRLFLSRTIGGAPNRLLAHDLLGAPLGSHLLSAPGPFSWQGLVFLGMFALLGVTAWAAARAARSMTPPATAGQPGGGTENSGAVGLVLRLAPYATLAVAAVVPLAAGLYLLTSTSWTLAERAVLRRRVRRDLTAPGSATAGRGRAAGRGDAGPGSQPGQRLRGDDL
jgi:YidC/Oxa1 family membrane protein insertase